MAENDTTGAKYDVIVTRVLDAPVEEVWRAWRDPEYVMQWWGPAGFTSPGAEMDFHVGGASLVCMRAPAEYGGQDTYHTWTYTAIEPHERIEFVSNFADENGRHLDPAAMGMPPGVPYDVPHVITFRATADGGTEMTVTEHGYTTEQARDLSRAGMEQCVDKMAAIFAGASAGPAAGPLVVSESNPRYFTVAADDATDRRAVYLTGSHVNNNFGDGSGPGADCAETPEPNDFRGYLEFLKERGHNFIRLWRWEQFKSQVAGGAFHLCMAPQPWPRTGPGTAKDGKPKFDLSAFDPAYFDRLRDYVTAASNEGIYVSVMLFEGFGLHLSLPPDNVEGHPFHAANNVNGIGITSIKDYQVLPLDARVQALQEAYIRKVVDTVQDLPNVLYEVANESSGGGSVDEQAFLEAIGLSEPPDWGDSTLWQYRVIDLVKQYEVQMGYARHPVGMTMQYPVADQSKVNDVLFESPADWISPGFDDVESPMQDSRWSVDPPANDGAKVIISDTDHYSPMKSDALWAWKSFLRGHNPILYDLGIFTGVNPPDPSSGNPSFASLEPARYAMGDTRRFAGRLNLIAMEPRGELSSTGYALANPGEEYLVLQPLETADPFTVSLEPRTYSAEWHSVGGRETEDGGEVMVGKDESTTFKAPFADAGPAVLYLKAVGA